jgi:hypothetical protein
VPEAVPFGDSEHSRKRAALLQRHADRVLDLRHRAAQPWEEMLAREVQLLVLDGLSPRLADQAARTNLALRKRDLDAELEEALGREREALRQALQRLDEEREDEEDGLELLFQLDTLPAKDQEFLRILQRQQAARVEALLLQYEDTYRARHAFVLGGLLAGGTPAGEANQEATARLSPLRQELDLELQELLSLERQRHRQAQRNLLA